MDITTWRNPGLNLIHLAVDDERTICKHYRVPKMEYVPTDENSGPWCSDCYMFMVRETRKEQNAPDATTSES